MVTKRAVESAAVPPPAGSASGLVLCNLLPLCAHHKHARAATAHIFARIADTLRGGGKEENAEGWTSRSSTFRLQAGRRCAPLRGWVRRAAARTRAASLSRHIFASFGSSAGSLPYRAGAARRRPLSYMPLFIDLPVRRRLVFSW
jgi:hypothetical protein